jgi:hypothetical protein
MANKRVLAGYADVDAGLIWVGDPCYIMGDDASNRVVAWHDFCDKLWSGDYDEKGFSAPLGQGVGVVVQSGYGDGTYPVYVEYADGRVKSVTVEFIGDDDE